MQGLAEWPWAVEVGNDHWLSPLLPSPGCHCRHPTLPFYLGALIPSNLQTFPHFLRDWESSLSLAALLGDSEVFAKWKKLLEYVHMET